jgi:stage II sporulation protein D
MGRRLRIATLAAGVALALVPTTAGATTWVAKGAGFGHGVGMSAYGAYGYGLHGHDHRQILAHYYTGTKITKLANAPRVRVLLDTRSGDVSFTKATSACGRKLSPAASYRGQRAGASVRLLSASGRRLASCGKKLRAGGGGTVAVTGLGSYRGALELVPVPGAGTLNVVNDVPVNAYVQGVLPSELFPSWPAETLKAFAIAMRSVAVTTDVHGAGFALYSDTRTQVYRGRGAETAATNAAARATRDEVVSYEGQTAQTTYFSASGGQTESSFLGAPRVPYLRSVDDPYDDLSPLHRWTVRFSQAEMDSRLAPHLKGSLRAIKVTQRGDSPRIDYARLVGSGGTTTVRGDTLQAALGLYSRWVSFKKSR